MDENILKSITELIRPVKAAYAEMIKDKLKDEANLIAFYFMEELNVSLSETRLLEGVRLHKEAKLKAHTPPELIYDSDISVRCLNMLKDIAVYNEWKELQEWSSVELLGCGISQKCLVEIREQLELRNLKLKGE